MSVTALKHETQNRAIREQSRFNFWLAGRRGGKTTGIRRDMTRSLRVMPNSSGLLYLGPSNQMAKELMWNELEENLYKKGWRFRSRISDQRFEFSRGRFIQILGAEKIRRVRGQKYFKVYPDEVAFYTVSLKEVWRALRPTLSDFQGGAIFSTTPNGKGTEAYDFYLDILNKPNWKFFHWKTLDNPYISRDEIESARRELDEKSFKQEYEAGWEAFEGLAYYCFEENLHIKQCSEFDFSVPIGMTLDFNVNPTSLLLAQKIQNHVFFRKEYSLKNSSTEKTIINFCEDFKTHKDKIHLMVHGDATGSSRKSATGRSDYYYLEEVLKHYGFSYQMKVPAVNPPIIDRVASANAWLKNVKGESRITIDPSCTDLIRDLSSQPLEGRFPSDKGNLGHKADAFGYYIYYQQTTGQARPTRSVEI